MNTLKRMSRVSLFFTMAVLLLGSAVQAQTLKVGFTDPEAIIANMKEYQTIQQQLQRDYQTSQTAMQALMDEYQEKVARYQKQQPLLTEESRAAREQELMAFQQEIQTAAAQKDDELAQKQADMMEPLLDRVQEVIDAIAAEKGLDMVLRSPAIIYINEDKIVDITLDVAKRLGIQISDASN